MASNGPVFEAGPGWGQKIAAWLRENLVYVIPGVAVLVLIFVLFFAGENENPLSSLSPAPSQTASLATGTISEIVVRGDSYTTVARRLISQATAMRSDTLPGQLVYAETILASEIKNQPLAVGSSVAVEKATAIQIFEGFTSLSPYQQRRWAQYRR